MTEPKTVTTKYRKKPIEIEAFQITEDLVRAHLWYKVPLPFGLTNGFQFMCKDSSHEN